jgi:hypothetical protein
LARSRSCEPAERGCCQTQFGIAGLGADSRAVPEAIAGRAKRAVPPPGGPRHGQPRVRAGRPIPRRCRSAPRGTHRGVARAVRDSLPCARFSRMWNSHVLNDEWPSYRSTPRITANHVSWVTYSAYRTSFADDAQGRALVQDAAPRVPRWEGVRVDRRCPGRARSGSTPGCSYNPERCHQRDRDDD